jgi:hypothetical protein
MNRADNRGTNNTKFKSKPSFSRVKSYAVDENDIIKNEQMLVNQKEERDKIRQHNLKVASGEIVNTKMAVNSDSEDEGNNSSKRRKEKKERKSAEKKALGSAPANNIVVTNHSSIPDSDTEEN